MPWRPIIIFFFWSGWWEDGQRAGSECSEKAGGGRGGGGRSGGGGVEGECGARGLRRPRTGSCSRPLNPNGTPGSSGRGQPQQREPRASAGSEIVRSFQRTISSATRRDTDCAATRRGCVHATCSPQGADSRAQCQLVAALRPSRALRGSGVRGPFITRVRAHAMRPPSVQPASWRYWGICVVFPQPVAPEDPWEGSGRSASGGRSVREAQWYREKKLRPAGRTDDYHRRPRLHKVQELVPDLRERGKRHHYPSPERAELRL